MRKLQALLTCAEVAKGLGVAPLRLKRRKQRLQERLKVLRSSRSKLLLHRAGLTAKQADSNLICPHRN